MLRLKKPRKLEKSYVPLWDIVTDYTTKTTIHGLRYLTEKKFSSAERVLWLFILIISVIICSYFIFEIIAKWNSSPVIMTFDSRATPMFRIPMPAVTVCPSINVRHDSLNISRITEALKNGNLSALNLDAEQRFHLKEILFRVCPNERTLWSTINVPKRDFIDVDMMLMFAMIAPPMNEIILGCNRGDGWERDCYKDFRMVFTAFGICYTWNALSPADFYRNDVVHTTEFGNTNFSKPSTWSLENGYTDTLKDGYPYNTIGGQSGRAMTFTFNIKTDNLKFGCSEHGFYVFLHSPSDVPMKTVNFIKVPLATDVRISVTPKMTATSDDLQNYAPSIRSCYYDAERYLKLFKVYSEKNCVFECMTNYTLRECGCNSFHFPRINGTKTCSLDQLKCIEKALNIYQEESYFKRSGEDVCKCKPACTSLVFHSDIQHTPADSINYIYEALEINSTESYSSSIVSVLYKESEFIPVIRSELFSKTDLVANCGGILGLFLGISLISSVEFVFFCAIRPFFYLRKE